MATKRDYYDILGVEKTAGKEEVTAAYKKKALEWHPDRNKSSEATERFKEINEAYEVLNDSEKRAAYDQFGHSAFSAQGGPAYGWEQGGGQTYQQGPFSYTYTSGQGGENFSFGGDFGGFSDPFEIFEQFFGGGSFSRSRQRRAHYSLEISFLEAVKGTAKKVVIDGKEKTIKIPPGVDTGSRIRFTDFDLSIEVKPDKNFRREGDDLFTSFPVSFAKAGLGGVIEVPTIEEKVKLRVQPGTQPGTMIRLRGKGVSRLSDHGRGDLYVRLNIVVPTRLSREERELLEKLARLEE